MTADGWQICSESLARVEGDENTVEFLFVETMPKDSRYGKSERYEKDDVMLSFTRKDERIQTNWGVLRKEHPVFIGSEEEIVGDYFLKATDEVMIETNSTSKSKERSAPKPLPTLAPPIRPTSAKASQAPKPTPTPTPKPKGDFPERSYKSSREFPYETMEFADEATYALIKEAYDAFTFSGKFKTGNLDLYDSYMGEFRSLVNSGITFTVPETGESFYLNEYRELKVSKNEVFEPAEFTYHVFDVNGDTTPELCIMAPGCGTYVFRRKDKTRTGCRKKEYRSCTNMGISKYCCNYTFQLVSSSICSDIR